MENNEKKPWDQANQQGRNQSDFDRDLRNEDERDMRKNASGYDAEEDSDTEDTSERYNSSGTRTSDSENYDASGRNSESDTQNYSGSGRETDDDFNTPDDFTASSRNSDSTAESYGAGGRSSSEDMPENNSDHNPERDRESL